MLAMWLARRHTRAALSEIGEFFDRRVMHYSRGMRARLSFSLFAFLEADLFVIDEALSGGDSFFKEKCHRRLAELTAGGTAVVMATHSRQAVREYCPQLLLLHQGQPLYFGTTAEGLRRFETLRGIERPARRVRLAGRR